MNLDLHSGIKDDSEEAMLDDRRKTQNGIWIIDTEAKTVYVNTRMAEMLGTTPSEMIGQPSFSYVFPEDLESAQRLFDFKKTGSADPFHFTFRRKDGSAIWMDVQATPMRDATGEFSGILGPKLSLTNRRGHSLALNG